VTTAPKRLDDETSDEHEPRVTLPATTTETNRALTLAGYVALALLAYIPPLLTAPGKIAADTKQYLYLDPGRLLRSAVSMWDPNVGMGTVTHQTIGYLYPMGPYYWILDRIGVPDWVAQRLWLGSLLFFAAVGVLFLARTFGLRGPGILVAAVAYMCSPYVLDYSARISVLLMPWAALPWMIAIVAKALRDVNARGRVGWRYPAIFALIVQTVGGVNATALLFAGIGPALWILSSWLGTRDVDFRRAFGVTWRILLLTVLTSLWWIAGLRMQGAYGLNVLKYSETVQAVARTSTPNEVLRSLGYWFFYGQDRLGPWIEAASDYTQHIWLILVGYGLAALGLLSAAFLRWKHRVFLVALLLVGVIIAVGAHPYDSPTPLGALFKAFANGSTAGLALRSTGRAVPLLVLALALFLGLATNVVSRWLRGRHRTALAIAVPAVVGVLVLVNLPALVNGTFYGKNLQRPSQIPAYWTQAIAALNAGNHQTRILEEPGSDFASYTWGNTVDPITPGLTDRPYVARELIPWGTPGSADLLNAIDRRLQEGIADPNGLAQLWRRMGIGDVVARNDIQYARYDLVRPQELQRVLAVAPGLGPPIAYGPPSAFPQAPGYVDERTLAEPLTPAVVAPVVEYPVTDPTNIVRGESTDNALMVSGDGEGLVDVADVGLLDNAGVIRYSASEVTPTALRAATGASDTLVVTDNNRLRARKWSSVKDNLGFTEQPGGADAPLTPDPGDARLDVFPGERPDALTTTSDVGVARVTASAYGNTITYTPEDRAARALDGDPTTAWRTQAFGDARGQIFRVDLDGPITTDHVNLVQPINGGRNRWITDVQLAFDGGHAVNVTLDDRSRVAAGQTITFPKRTFQHFEIKIMQTNDHRTNLFGQSDSVGFAEVRLRDQHASHDVHLTEIETMPSDLLSALGASSASHDLVYVMRRQDTRPVPPRTQPELNISREFTLPSARTFALTGNATVSTDAPDAAIEGALGITGVTDLRASAKEFLEGCMACRADSALDGDPATAWQTPFTGVIGQWIQFDAARPVTFDHLNLQLITDGRHSVPTKLRLDVDGQTRTITVPPLADKAAPNATTTVPVKFAPVSGRRIRVTIEGVRESMAKLYAANATRLEPAGIAELGVPGLQMPPAPARIDSGCRSDLLDLDGRPVPVRIAGAAASATTEMGLTVTPCDGALRVSAGPHVLTTARGKDVAFSLDRLVLASGANNTPMALGGGHVAGFANAPTAPTVTVTHNGRTKITAHVTGATEPFWLVLGQSQSNGWQAHIVHGSGLGTSELVDGYANGWKVTPPAAAFDVVFQWTPQRQVWDAIWVSLVAALACVAIVAVTWWRRRGRLADAVAPASADARVDLAWSPWGTGPLPRRVRWVAPVLAGLLGALVVAPWVGLLIAALCAVIVWRPTWRRVVLVAPAALLGLCGLYVALEQYRFRYPTVFEWPTLFPHARTVAWIAVALIAADAVVELVAGYVRRSNAPEPETQ